MDGSVAPGRWVGERLEGRYHLLRLLDERGQAEVYEAEDERLQRRVTVHLAEGDTDLASLSDSSTDEVLDAGEHDGRPFVVLPLADEAVVVGPGAGDDEPTGELPTVTDHTMVLPAPLVPVDPTAAPAGEPSRTAGAVRSLAGGLWARRVLLAAVAGAAVLLLIGLAARDDSLEVPTQGSVPVTAEITTTTIAPTTTTSPPTTEEPAEEGRGDGKGKDKEEKDDD